MYAEQCLSMCKPLRHVNVANGPSLKTYLHRLKPQLYVVDLSLGNIYLIQVLNSKERERYGSLSQTVTSRVKYVLCCTPYA
jgi:hypothetical protein